MALPAADRYDETRAAALMDVALLVRLRDPVTARCCLRAAEQILRSRKLRTVAVIAASRGLPA
jgi:hypothetical protein